MQFHTTKSYNMWCVNNRNLFAPVWDLKSKNKPLADLVFGEGPFPPNSQMALSFPHVVKRSKEVSEVSFLRAQTVYEGRILMS